DQEDPMTDHILSTPLPGPRAREDDRARAARHAEGHPAVSPGDIAVGVIIGRTSEYFDFFTYGIASVIVFPQVFFPFADPLTRSDQEDPMTDHILSTPLPGPRAREDDRARAARHAEGHPAVSPGDIAVGVIIGRTSEYFDFFTYGIASVIVFPQVFFPFADPLT